MKLLNWTDLGHDNLDRLMRVYFKKQSSLTSVKIGNREPQANVNFAKITI